MNKVKVVEVFKANNNDNSSLDSIKEALRYLLSHFLSGPEIFLQKTEVEEENKSYFQANFLKIRKAILKLVH